MYNDRRIIKIVQVRYIDVALPSGYFGLIYVFHTFAAHFILSLYATRMHSSGMRTARLTVSQHVLCRGCVSHHALGRGLYPSMHWAWGCLSGGCLPMGVCPWGVCPGGCLLRGVSAGGSAWGVSAQGGVCLGVSAWEICPRGLCAQGCVCPEG